MGDDAPHDTCMVEVSSLSLKGQQVGVKEDPERGQ